MDQDPGGPCFPSSMARGDGRLSAGGSFAASVVFRSLSSPPPARSAFSFFPLAADHRWGPLEHDQEFSAVQADKSKPRPGTGWSQSHTVVKPHTDRLGRLWIHSGFLRRDSYGVRHLTKGRLRGGPFRGPIGNLGVGRSCGASIRSAD